MFSTLTKNISILFFSFSVSFPFQHRKRNNCFTRSFHAFSFEPEFAGGRAFARGPLFSKKKGKKREKGKRKREKKIFNFSRALRPEVRPEPGDREGSIQPRTSPPKIVKHLQNLANFPKINKSYQIVLIRGSVIIMIIMDLYAESGQT